MEEAGVPLLVRDPEIEKIRSASNMTVPRSFLLGTAVPGISYKYHTTEQPSRVHYLVYHTTKLLIRRLLM